MRTTHPIAAVVTAASIVLSGFVFAPAAKADTPREGDRTTDERNSVMTIPYDPTFIRVETDTTGFTVFAYPQCDLAAQCRARIELPDFGIDAYKVSTKDGYKISWPSAWAEGTTYDKGTIRSLACDGLLICNASRKVSLPAIKRPYRTDPLRINYTGKDDAARTMTVAGQATKNASIRLKGGSAAVSANGAGLWSMTIGGLSLGSNTRTIQQYVGGDLVDEKDASVTIVDPVKQGQVVGESGTADLQRGATTPVSVSFTAKSAFHTPTGKLVVTAPEGTTFAPGQDRQRGEYLEGGTWHRFGGDSLVDGSRAPDGRTYTFQLGNRDWDVTKDQRFRFTLDVQTPADVATTTSSMTGKLSGTFPGASFDTTATTTTTVVDQALSARIESQDAVARTATLAGTAPRRADSLDVTWERDGGTVTRTVTPTDGAWRFVVDGLRDGDTTVRVVAKVGGQALGDPVSVTVHLDAAPFSATARFEGDVTKPVVIEGSGTAGGTVRIEGAWTTVPPVPVGVDGHWSVTVPAPDQPGKQSVTAVQTVDGQPAGSERVEVDYGRAVRITSPGDGFQITPIWNSVRVIGKAEPHAQVRLGEGGDDDAYGSVEANADGDWAITTPPLALREHDLVATALSKGANTTRDTVRIVPEG